MRVLRGFGAPPSELDQAASTLVVALEDSPAGGASSVAVEVLRRFSPLDRTIVGMKAIALGANAASVEQAIYGTISDSAPASQTPSYPPGPIMSTLSPPSYRKYWIAGGIAAIFGIWFWHHRKAEP